MFKKQVQKIEKITLCLLLILLPTQLAYHFWPSWAFVFGIRVDLLAPSIYLTDLLVTLLFLLKVFMGNKNFFRPLLKYKIWLGLFLVLAILNCVFSTSAPVSIYKWLKIAEFSFLAFYFYKQQLVRFSSIIAALFYSSTVFSLIGIIQFIKGGTIGGPLYFLGERTFNLSTSGIALVSLNGVEHLRAYSTFSHPNSLAGFLGVVLVLALTDRYFKKTIFKTMALVITSVCFILTFSFSAYTGILVVLFFYLISGKQKLLKLFTCVFLLLSIASSLLLPLLSPWIFKMLPLIGQNTGQRLDLAYIAGRMISQKFLIGEGLGAFVVNTSVFKGVFFYSWLLQPVHNIFLLVFTETGIIGFLFFCLLFYKTIIKNPFIFIFIVFTGLLDHYWLTLQQNLLLLSILFGLSAKMSSWRKT